MRNGSDVDLVEYVAARLNRRAEKKERKRLEKEEAHLFAYLRIATEQDFADQVGKDRWFDLVDFEKVCKTEQEQERKPLGTADVLLLAEWSAEFN